MSWQVVAKRTMLDPYRSRYLWVIFGVIGLLFGGTTHLASGGGVLSVLMGLGMLIVPLLAIAGGYRSIAEPRQTGSLRVILAYPHSRRDVVVGTAIGQSVLTAGFVSFGFLVASVVALVEFGSLNFESVSVIWIASVLLGVSVTALAVGISAAASTVNRAAIGSFGSILLFFGGWNLLPAGIRYVINGFSLPSSPPPAWVDVFVALNPTQAFTAVVDLQTTPSPMTATGFQPEWWFGVLVLLGWMVVPLVSGLWLFERRDL